MNNDNSHENNIPTELTGPVLVNQEKIRAHASVQAVGKKKLTWLHVLYFLLFDCYFYLDKYFLVALDYLMYGNNLIRRTICKLKVYSVF